MKNNSLERLFIGKIAIMFDINERINNAKTIGELDALQNKINEAFDIRRRVLNLVSEASNVGSKSFGYIKESFENLSPSLCKTKEGKALVKRYAKVIKENESLTALHRLYENIRKAHSDMDMGFFIGSLCETNWNVSKKELNEGLKKLSDVITEAYIVVGEGADKYLGTVNDRLDNAIEFIAENNKSVQSDLVKYSEAVKIIREAVEKNGNISDSFNKDTDLDKTVEELIKKFSKNPGDKEDEKTEIANNLGRSDEESVFKTKKENCLNGLDEAIKKYERDGDKEEAEALKKIHEQVEAKSYNPETIGADICNFVEMTKLFE